MPHNDASTPAEACSNPGDLNVPPDKGNRGNTNSTIGSPAEKLDKSQPQHIQTKSTPTLMIPRSEVERLLADTAVYEGKPLEQGRTSNRSGGEASH